MNTPFERKASQQLIHLELTLKEMKTVEAAIKSYRDLISSPTSADRDAMGSAWADEDIRTCETLLKTKLAGQSARIITLPVFEHPPRAQVAQTPVTGDVKNSATSDDVAANFLAMLATSDVAIIDGHIEPAWRISSVTGNPLNEVVLFTWTSQTGDHSVKLTESGLSGGYWLNSAFHCVDHEGDLTTITLRCRGLVMSPQTIAAGTLDQLPAAKDAHAVRADTAFEEYDFGDGVMVTDVSGWEYSTPGHERTRRVFVDTRCDGDSHSSSTALTFTVRFDPDTGDVSKATALDDKGQFWGRMPSKVVPSPSSQSKKLGTECRPSERLKSAVLNTAFLPGRIKSLKGSGFLAGVHLSTNVGVFVVAGNFGREHFKKALSEAEQAGLSTHRVYVYGQTATYSGNAIHFTKFEDIGIDLKQYIGQPEDAAGPYTASEVDVENVLRSNSLSVANTKGKTFESIANEVFANLDFDLIDQAALGGDSMEERVDLANDEIARQLREMGILEPL